MPKLSDDVIKGQALGIGNAKTGQIKAMARELLAARAVVEAARKRESGKWAHTETVQAIANYDKAVSDAKVD